MICDCLPICKLYSRRAASLFFFEVRPKFSKFSNRVKLYADRPFLCRLGMGSSMSLTHWELSQICDSERAFIIMIYSNFHWIFCHRWSWFWEFGANHLISRLQLHHVPVHETHSTKVRKFPMTRKTPSLNRIVGTGKQLFSGIHYCSSGQSGRPVLGRGSRLLNPRLCTLSH